MPPSSSTRPFSSSSAAVFHRHGVEIATIEEAHQLLPAFLGKGAPILFAIALLCAGQSSTLTGTLAGQIVMEGFLHLKIAPWLRRLITRFIALIPAVIVIGLAGERSTQQLLVLSQVVLSLQLSFAVIPLIHFTSNRRNMGAFATPWWGQVLAWSVAGIIVALNGKLVFAQVRSWIELAAQSGIGLGAVPLEWLVAAACLCSLRASPAFCSGSRSSRWFDLRRHGAHRPASASTGFEALRPHSLSTIGVALEHGKADAEILNRALSLIQPDHERPALLLLHVVDTPVTRVHGADTADRETGSDARYLDELVQTLRDRGYRARSVLLYGPDPAGQLVSYLRKDPVDLLVVGSHGHGLVRDLLFGQTVDRVRHQLSVPMLIARPGREPSSTAATKASVLPHPSGHDGTTDTPVAAVPGEAIVD